YVSTADRAPGPRKRTHSRNEKSNRALSWRQARASRLGSPKSFLRIERSNAMFDSDADQDGKANNNKRDRYDPPQRIARETMGKRRAVPGADGQRCGQDAREREVDLAIEEVADRCRDRHRQLNGLAQSHREQHG